ncbi:TetR/AcrR family transcriptional regulator [Nocardioides sp.]|uniref:TetR/AcrR family transcriptional regulator n=1 Tax=Nocardioides sp. TaxID=35761 RepID=UPI002C935705|nr:TetR/AcrR family transcriptional regulator [Nocardioides sp.]HSX69226.1 TetR/AcrR family transcriptional regulator [Nocardioides sp.]
MDVRDQLVQAGVELLEAKGLASLTQRQIATRVGVSHGAPRHYFPTYANLLAAIARVGVEELDATIRAGLAIPDARSALSSVAENVVNFAIDRPAMFELIARHDLLEGAGGNLREITSSWLELLTTRIRDIRADADERHGLALWAGVQGLGTMLGRRSTDVISTQKVNPKPVLAVLIDGITQTS